MSRLSEYLDYLLTQKNISKYELAKKVGVDNSSFYKMLSGQRKISEELLDRILSRVPFTCEEAQELKREYRILLIGEEKYRRRREVLRFINALNEERETAAACYDAGAAPLRPGSVNGKGNFCKAVFSIILSETGLEAGSLKVICQTDFSFLYDTLELMDEQAGFKVEQILCFENRSRNREAENIRALAVIAPLLKNLFSYSLYYYYDSTASCCGPMVLFPFMILGTGAGIVFSADYESGVVFTEPETVETLARRFEKIRRNASALLSPCGGVGDVRQKMTKRDIQEIREPYVLCPNVYISNNFDMQSAVRLLRDDLPNRAELEQLIQNELKSAKGRSFSSKVHGYFTREGLLEFWNTGHLIDILTDCYKPLSEPERETLLRNVLEDIRSDKLDARLLREGTIRFARDFYLIMPSGSRINCILRKKDGSFGILEFQESLLCEGMADFFRSMEEEGLIETKEETVRFLSGVIEQGFGS